MTKLEDIGAALYRSEHPSKPTPYHALNPPVRERYEIMARAAVEAMRKPSPLMYTTANDMEVNYKRQLKSFDVFGFCGLTYVAMIDAILNEPEDFDYVQDIAEKIPPTETPDPERIRRAILNEKAEG